MQTTQVRKFEREEGFFKTSAERQDFFMVYDGAVWLLYPYISLETAVYSSGSERAPDVLLLDLGGGRSVEIQGRNLLRVLQAFQGRMVVSLAPGETEELAIVGIEALEKANAATPRTT